MNTNPPGDDLTPEVGSQTDIAPLGRDVPPPAHEQTASDDPGRWHAIAETAEFKELIAAKLRFIIPATVFFMVYYLALPILVGYFPKFMETTVWGDVNLAYLFALSQFPMVWILAGIYVSIAAGWDRRAAALIAHLKN